MIISKYEQNNVTYRYNIHVTDDFDVTVVNINVPGHRNLEGVRFHLHFYHNPPEKITSEEEFLKSEFAKILKIKNVNELLRIVLIYEFEKNDKISIIG